METVKKIPTFYWEYKRHTPPEFSLDDYKISVCGRVRKPLSVAVRDLPQVLPFVEARKRFYCVNGWTMEDVWGGFRLEDLMAIAGPEAEYLRTTSIGGYEDTARLADLINGGAMLATHMGGASLAPKRGFPIRLLVFDMYQFKGVKSVATLDLTDEYRPGTWQKVGYRDATIQPYPHLDIRTGKRLMPESVALKSICESEEKK
jgi:DMSO/TMAO reductase YedYZ molybdopterin-dependent catalytic subunit